MIKRIANIGKRPYLNVREIRVIQLTNLMAFVLGIAVFVSAFFNIKLGEVTNGSLLVGLALMYFSILVWNNQGYFIVSKIILSFSITLIPFLNVVMSGNIPVGQFFSLVPSCLVSFSCLLFIVDRHSEAFLYYFGVAYYVLYASLIDVFIIGLSETKPDIALIEDNYYYYKAPFVICMLLLVVVFRFFKNILYTYENQAERNQKALEAKNVELIDLNHTLESKVESRTIALSESNEKLIDLAFITAHEIRGPLTSIMSVTDYLTNNIESPVVSEVLPQLHVKSKKMDEVIIKMVKKLEGEVGSINKNRVGN